MSDAVDHAAYLVRHQHELAEAAEREGRPSDVERFVLAHGGSYSRVAPRRTERMTPNACFENSASLSRTPGMTYVEGSALVAVPRLLAIHHAWCVDAEGLVHEPTWRTVGLAYFGVPFATDYVARRMAAARHPEHGLLRGDGCGALLDGDEKGWRA